MLLCIDDVLDHTELRKLRELISMKDFIDGKKTAGARARRVKENEQLDKSGSEEGKKINDLIFKSLRRNKEVQRGALPKKIKTPIISRYKPGMQYGLHVDDALMGEGSKVRGDVSCTIFLNDPSEYEGGELTIRTSFGEQQIKMPAGTAVIYPSTTLHRVESVTAGEPLCAVTWIESYVRDASKREILRDCKIIYEHLLEKDADAEATDLAQKTHANLLRMYADT